MIFTQIYKLMEISFYITRFYLFHDILYGVQKLFRLQLQNHTSLQCEQTEI